MGATCSIAKLHAPKDTVSEQRSEPKQESNLRIGLDHKYKMSRTSSISSLKRASQQSTESRRRRTPSVSSLNKTSNSDTLKTASPVDSSEDLIVPENRDEVDALVYDPKTKQKYFGPEKTDESSTSEKKITPVPIPAKNNEDLKAAQELVKKYPYLQDVFFQINAAAVELAVMCKKQDRFVVSEITQDLEMSYFMYMEDRHILGDYLTFLDMPQLLYTCYDLVMKKLNFDYWTETKLKSNNDQAQAAFMFVIRNLIWNYTDASTLFGERLTMTGLFQYYMKDLEAMKEDISEPENIDFVFESAMGAIHNCSKSAANRQTFYKLDTVDHIIPYLKCESPKVKMIVLLTLAYIINEDQNELLLADENVHGFLIKFILASWNSPDHRFGGFTVEELVAGLMGLAKNDQNKELLMESGALPVLTAILKSGSDGEMQPALECIWELSFNTENKKIILADEKLMKLLTDLSKSDKKMISKAASGALWVLNVEERKKKQERVEERSTKMKKKPTGHVMLSYNWADQKTVIQVKERLRQAGFHVWMDIDNMGGSTLQAMAEAVEQSAVFLICMSDHYKHSQNCRNEAEYAFSLKKDIVPLLMERGYQPDGWLGMIKGTKLFFEFSGKYSFEKKIDDLIKELGSRGKVLSERVAVEDNQVPIIKSAPLQAGKGATVAEWSTKDVQNWLHKNKLTSNTALNTLTGEQLEFLHKLSIRAPEFYFGYIERKLGLSSLEDMMLFSKAVDRL